MVQDMATSSDPGRTADARSAGGKIMRKRRRRPTTPYDRPSSQQLQSQPQPKSLNWLTSVIFPATRRIASGGAKLFSLLFELDGSDSSSSHSSSDSDSEVANDDNDYDQLDDLCDTEMDHEAPSESMQCISQVHQLSTWKSEKTRAIEKLLMQESYSREECDRLTHIINSRVVDSTVKGAEAHVTTGTPDKTIQNGTDDILSKAIMEARKWLKEKKVLSSPLSEGADVSCGLESIAVQQIDNEVASPVDVAKTYMRTRPPWASPFAERVELQTPPTIKGNPDGNNTSRYYLRKRKTRSRAAARVNDVQVSQTMDQIQKSCDNVDQQSDKEDSKEGTT